MSYTVNNYQSMIENLLYKKSKKYDLIVFDNIYSKKFESYFLDLKDLLPQEHLDLYSEGIAAQTCIFKKKWVVFLIFFFFFFFESISIFYIYFSIFITFQTIYFYYVKIYNFEYITFFFKIIYIY